MLLVLNYVLRLCGGIARDRRDLVLEHIALRHQVDVLTRTRRRPALLLGDRLLWLSLSRTWPAWRKHLVIVQPDTVVRWHRAGWRRYWRWRSRPGRRGRPRIDPAIAVEIQRMTEENPRWGHMRVLGELRKLGFRVSLQTVRRYRKDVPRDPSPGWRTFLENHRTELWAADLFAVHTLWFQTLYVFFFIAHDRRTLVHVNVTAHPTAAATDQRHAVGHEPALPDPGPRPFLRRALRRTGEEHRHPHRAHADRDTAGQWHRRAARGHVTA